MQFQVPQFIETEVKIVGPFTLKQFLWLALGATSIFLLKFVLSPTVLFFVGIPIAVLSIALAFYKVDGTPLFNYLMYGLSYIISPKKFIFTKKESRTTEEQFDAAQFIKDQIKISGPNT